MFNATEASYRAYWATLTDRSEREVYVPEALRPETFEEGEVAVLNASAQPLASSAVQESMERRG